MEGRNRKQESSGYREEWRAQQCGGCAFWVPLAGSWGLDYGACTNPASPFDRRAQFEHDGCDEFAQAAEWGSPDDPELNLS
jgi:Protein of unknown function (DUF3027)